MSAESRMKGQDKHGDASTYRIAGVGGVGGMSPRSAGGWPDTAKDREEMKAWM